MALMNNSSIKFSKHPYVINYEIKQFDNHLQINQSWYNVEALKQNELEKATQTGDIKEPIWLPAYIDEALPIIIDPETAIPVQREIYFDEECKEWKAKIKVMPKKAYFAFQIKSEESDLVRTPLVLIDIGRFYRDGKYGFPKNVTKAVEFFEKDGSADALYEISYLFRSESSLFD